MKKGLTEKERLFCFYFAEDGDARGCAARAGFSVAPKRSAARLLGREEIRAEIAKLEKAFDDDTESIITNERYEYISSIIDQCSTKTDKEKLTISDKIDRVVTNRILALPIFAVIMFLVYYISVTTVGTYVTDWTNDGLFGDGWSLFGIQVPGIPVLVERGLDAIGCAEFLKSLVVWNYREYFGLLCNMGHLFLFYHLYLCN